MIVSLSRSLTLLLLTLLLITPGPAPAEPADNADAPAYDPIGMYEVRAIRGWDVYVNQRLLDEADLAAEVLDLLDHRLADVNRLLPDPALEKLHTVRIWVELEHPTHPLIHYHPNRQWLVENDFLPQKAGGVEIGNARSLLRSGRQQPAVLIHELAHAWHHQFLPDGYRNREIRDAYEQASDSGGYENVLHIAGHRTRHYALTNPMEYFAEGSEAYFSTNDFYPFVQAELKEHDPTLYELLERLWHHDEEAAEADADAAAASVTPDPVD